MEKLKHRVTNLIFSFNIQNNVATNWGIFPYTLNYEEKIYRQKELCRIIKDTIVHFGLTPEEMEKLKLTNDFGEMDRVAWSRISKARKDKKGDYGELLLFLILSVFFPTKKFVTKVRLRSSRKDQIKGFDCAHFSIDIKGEVSLWLGEAKFHQVFSNAINSAVESINEHLEINYLKDEISILGSNIEINSKFDEYDKIEDILNGGKSFDEIKIVIPVLITYDCNLIEKHNSINDSNFKAEMENELIEKIKKINTKTISPRHNVEIIFIILPLAEVKEIKDYLEKLEEVSL